MHNWKLDEPTGSTTIADSITQVYFGESPDKLQEELNQILNSVYGRADPVCWKLWYYDPPENNEEKVLVKEECTGEKKDLLHATTIIPLPNKKPIMTITSPTPPRNSMNIPRGPSM